MSERERSKRIDEIVTNQTYFALKEASYLFQVLHRVSRKSYLEDDITPEAKRALRRDMEFDSLMIRNLTEAQKAYRDMERRIDILESNFDKKLIDNRYWDMAMANVHFRIACMMAIDSVTEHNPDLLEKVIGWILALPMPSDVEKVVKLELENMNNLLKGYVKNKKDESKD